MEHIKGILDELIRRLGHEQKLKEKLALLYWYEVAGPELAGRTVPAGVKGGLLFVTVENHVWAHQLLYVKPILLKRLNQRLGRSVIRDIRFQVGSLVSEVAVTEERQPGPVTSTTGSEPVPAAGSIPSPEGLAAVIGAIPISEIREAFQRVYILAQAKAREKRGKGYKDCPLCGTLIPPEESLCPFCLRKVISKGKE